MELFNTDRTKLACYKLLLPAKCNWEILQSWFYKASFPQHWFCFSKIYIIYSIYKKTLRALLDIDSCALVYSSLDSFLTWAPKDA